VELAAPVVTDQAREFGFTNELGAGGTTRLLKNISGLYILQQCRSAWAAEGHDLSYAELAAMAEHAPPLRSLIRPDAPLFSTPGDMPGRVTTYCRQTSQQAPQNAGQFVRCVYESLALLYRQTLLELQQLIGQAITRLHIVGGGSRATLLNQLSADACDVTVIAGPVEATSIGNALVQAAALGHIQAGDIRTIVRDSVSPQIFKPRASEEIHASLPRFLKLPLI
jgi:rhamnulokinase